MIQIPGANRSDTHHQRVIFKPFFLDRQDFGQIETLQKKRVSKIKSTNHVLILGMEFNQVITLGLRAKKDQEVFPSGYRSPIEWGYNIPIIQTDRGGFATLHSPGQLVIYPMIDLMHFKLGIKKYIEILFLTTQDFLNKYQIVSNFDEKKPGLYTQNGKISFVGIKVDQGVVRHGIAINIYNDLNLFKLIRSCGISCQSHDKFGHYASSSRLHLKELFHSWVESFKINLDFEFSRY